MKIKYLSIVMLLLLTFTAKAQNKPVYLDPNASVEARVQDALSRMTTHEKVRILHAQSKFSSAGVPRLGIRELHHSDGPHGVRAEVDWNSWGSANWNNDSIVAFPSLTCLAATWNREMSAIYGTAIGEEFAFRDKNLLLGPGTTIARMPLNGRSFEYMGEDPYLAGELAVPYIKNVQKSGVGCLGSYNLWNNVHCCQNDELLNKILKQQWGFDGAVVSDWGGVTDTWQAALGGMDIEMGSYTNGKTVDNNLGWNKYFLADPFEELINEGKIPMDVLNDKAARVLRTIFRTSMNPNKAIGSQCSEAHYDACQQVGEEGIVLLKNQKDFLPLDASKYSKVLVVGENATRSLTEGGGSSELKTKFDISPLDGLKAVFGDGVDYAKGYVSGRAMYDFIDKISPDTLALLRAEAIEKAKNADLVIYVGGLNKNTYEDCEANDRLSYDLSFGQNELIAGLAKANKNVVVVTFGGNPYATPWLANVQALVHCWYLGSMAGTSIANVLTGKVNPSGKLPVTWAVNMNDYPCFKYGKEGYPGVDKQVYYKEGIYVGYRYFDTNKVRPQFPFGFGLSYTTFKYGKATVSSPQMTSDGSVTVSIPVTNVGKVDGKEIVQLYIGDDKCSVDRPVKELKNFCKLSLKPGETKTATFTIRPSDLEFYDEAKHQFVAEPGTFKAYLCASETDVRSSVAFELK